MAMITLHRASRIQDQVRAAVGALSIESHTRLSIFANDADAEVERLSHQLVEDIGRLQRLLSVLAAVRTAVGQQNIGTGISALLAEKAAVEEELALLSKLLDDRPTKSTGLDYLDPGRRREHTRAMRGRVSLDEQIRASRARFEGGEDGDDTIRVPLLDEAQHEAIRARMRDQRRRLEEIAETLRALNSTGTVEIADDVLDFLREAGVF